MRNWKAAEPYYPTLQNGGLEIHFTVCMPWGRPGWSHLELVDQEEVLRRHHKALGELIQQKIAEHRELGQLLAENVDGVSRPNVRPVRTH